jgi:hypothetical protein
MMMNVTESARKLVVDPGRAWKVIAGYKMMLNVVRVPDIFW